MSQIQFDETKFKIRSHRILGNPEVPGMIKVLVTRGIVKTEKQAIAVLLSFIVVLSVITFFVFNTGSVKPATIDKEYIS
jgi:hypothetical protein